MLRPMAAENRGFTLIEVVISLTVGIIVLSGALSFAIGIWRNLEGNAVREDVYRDARYIEMSLERDFQDFRLARKFEVEHNRVKMERLMEMSVLDIPLEKYPDLQAMQKEDDVMGKGQVILKKAS